MALIMEQRITLLALKVTRAMPDIVCPAKPTPREQKLLSDLDDQEGLRFHMPAIMFYKANPLMNGKDPVKVIKDALAKALVFYYPLAGRLVEGTNRKLVVDCTGEGVPFIEAEANASLDDFGPDQSFPLEDLLYDIPGTHEIIGTPLLVFQVTRLKCGGFIVALQASHTLTDGTGIMQLMNAVGEMGRGFTTPSILPVWERERLTARNPPRVTFDHHEYDQHDTTNNHHANGYTGLVQQSLLFGATQLAALRTHFPPHIKKYSTFDLLSASLWRCRIRALGLKPDDEVRLMFSVNARNKFDPPLGKGYYGNACAFPVVCAKVNDICENQIGYVLELIRKTKGEINEEYMRSTMDLMVTKDRPHYCVYRTYDVSDLRHLGFTEVDFGWGKPVFGGPASYGSIPNASFFISYKNREGESMIMVTISLPHKVMKVFLKELQGMLQV
ncbi:benzyl alcohol O-benzoyltransferase-like isoform X1 [Silene latifolia]|uniref:benzyl alcohol O-benzoyltransferase-like isoform X1 n=1 Tax=Silene latifolia TaxID=37657 RepID=UPI003D776CCA